MEPICRNGRVLILRRDARLYVPESGDAATVFQSVETVKDPLVREMVSFWKTGDPPSARAFSIRHGGQTWWCGFRPLESANRNIWIGVTVPISDITGGIQQRRAGLWGIGALVISVAGGLAFWLIRRYGRRFKAAGDRFDAPRSEEDVHRLIAMGEGGEIEFKSSMRMNLHTQKPGKEIELAWLKAVAAFLNTDGGTLLLGVADDGEIVGIEHDQFENEDKRQLHFKNLIHQHIGAEVSGHLRFSVIHVADKPVGVVDCARSPEPVYLKAGKSEAFYIRSGPSSVELPVSKVVGYIQNRDAV